MKFFKKINLMRIALLAGAITLILLLLPRDDHQSYTYELNQPWRYQLLTADFDIPIMRDSSSVRRMHDSIDANFISFVTRSDALAKQNVERFRTSVANTPPHEKAVIASLLDEVFRRGVVDAKLYRHIQGMKQPKLRLADEENGANSVETIDASEMLSPSKAFEYIDSAYRTHPALQAAHPIEGEVAKALNVCLMPNIIPDTTSDRKFLNQEYTVVNAGLGVIKKGQRIVDRGEIVTPQIFTNLNTYTDRMEKDQTATSSRTYFLVGQGLYVFLWFMALYIFMATYRPVFFADIKKMVFLMCFITIFVVFSVLMFEYVGNGIYLVPFAAVPVVIMIFFDSRTAIFAHLTTVMISALVAIYPLMFIFLELMVGLVAAFSIHQLSQRSQLLRTALFTLLSYVAGYFAICLISDGDLSNFQWRMVGTFAVNAVELSFAYILILIVERVFGFTSTVTLVELSDINNPLLRRLAEEAPGTFQHSMQVSTLASEAARAIGANTQLVRTGALYHDIGKMESPIFFTENQHGVNPHTGLNPETSAQKIISHVTAGVAIASKNKLPQVIKDFILEHHGKSVTRYFYNTAVNENPDKTIDRSKFQYPGPNPQSKETAILMMADAVEAASRSLKDYSASSIDSLVDKIIDGQAAEGAFKESPISFRDVETVKKTFKKRLATIYHSRIAYPELKKKETPEANKNETPDVIKSE